MTIQYDFGEVATTDQDILHTTQWRDEVIAKRHAFNPICNQILNRHLNTDFLSLGIQGKSSTGKTTLAKDIMHTLHMELAKLKKSKNLTDHQKEILNRGHYFRVLTKNDLVHFTETFENMPHQNRIIYFDDLSFLESIIGRRNLGLIKNAVTEVRHIDESLSVNTILLYGYHYSYGLDKFLRDTDYRFYLSVSDEEEGNIISQIHATPAQKGLIKSFKKFNTRFKEKNKITIQLSKDRQDKYGSVTYQYSDPFRLMLFYNGETLKVSLFPKFEWLASDCTICANLGKSEKQKKRTQVSKGKIRKWLFSRYKPEVLEQAVKMYTVSKLGYFNRKNESMQLKLIFDILLENGVTTIEELISAVLGDPYLEMVKKRVKSKRKIIPEKTKNDFFLSTGYDGLHTANKPPRSKKDIKTIKKEDLA